MVGALGMYYCPVLGNVPMVVVVVSLLVGATYKNPSMRDGSTILLYCPHIHCLGRFWTTSEPTMFHNVMQ